MNSSFSSSTFVRKRAGNGKEAGRKGRSYREKDRERTEYMYDYRIVEQVKRKKKPMSEVLSKCIAVFAFIFVMMGIMISQAFMLSGFLLAGLYFVFNAFSRKEYEYILDNNTLVIDVIYGGKYRRTAHELDLDKMEVTAPNMHPSVAKYRRNGGTEQLKKYDYTSYDENILYYTMIVTEDGRKIKLLLDLTDNMLQVLKTRYPKKVFFAQ